MAKYHLNPEKGPMPCRAKSACRYGADTPHFTDLAEAQAAYEAQLKEELPMEPVQRKSLPEGILLRRLDELLPEEASALADGRTLRELQKTLRSRRDEGSKKDGVLRAYAAGDPFAGPSAQTLAALRERRAMELQDESLLYGALSSEISRCRSWSAPSLTPSAELSVVGAFAEQDLEQVGLSPALPQAIVEARSPRLASVSRHEALALIEARESLAAEGNYVVFASAPQKLSPTGVAISGLVSEGEENPTGLITYADTGMSSVRARCETLAAMSSAGMSFALMTGEGIETERLDSNSPVAPGVFDGNFSAYRQDRLLPWLAQHSIPAA